MTSPAFARNRMSRVEATFSARRNRVVSRSSVGNVAIPIASGTYKTTSRMATAQERLVEMRRSSTHVGSGTIISATTTTTSAASAASALQKACARGGREATRVTGGNV